MRPAKDAAPTKRWEDAVCTTRTSWPAFVASRTSSSALYAAMPPETPSRRRAMRLAGVAGRAAYRYW